MKNTILKTSTDILVLQSDFTLYTLQISMSAEMAPISADTTRSVRIPEAATTAPAHVATDLREWDGPVLVRTYFMSLTPCHFLISNLHNRS